ncbi:Ger(x)C family spore germination protein [Paenibacillus elgii]|uniref:Ger(X)C family spore germination protein n=1 Tax=Paenibacillus elgii TaxID=189691 RepID=A0A2T6G9I5_9BACL|nr:Ger(x)C family spore germination protein [Paenibacillus elgii]PUA40817.1 Ger(x)C family spore germination protein [Paenibacillus elgii]
MVPGAGWKGLRLAMTASAALLLLLLPGCWDRKEVNDLAIIMAAGLDKAEGGLVKLSVQLFVPRVSGGGGQDSGGSGGGGKTPASGQTILRSATGNTLADAMTKLQEKLSRRIFWGHGEVFVFGEALAREGIRENIDFILRDPGPRERAEMFICKGRAQDILTLMPPLERSSAESLREMAKSQTGLKVTVKDFAEMLVSDAGAAALPWIETLPAQPGSDAKRTDAYINGSVILKKDRMVGFIDDRVTRGLLWLRDEVEAATVTLAPKEGRGLISFKILDSRTKLLPLIEGDRWSVTVRIQTEDDVIQNTTNINLVDPKVTESLEKQLSAEIEKRIREALVHPQKELHADIFNFAEAFHRRYPQLWKKEKQRWEERFPQVEVRIESRARIVRTGMATVQASQPKNEVKPK